MTLLLDMLAAFLIGAALADGVVIVFGGRPIDWRTIVLANGIVAAVAVLGALLALVTIGIVATLVGM